MTNDISPGVPVGSHLLREAVENGRVSLKNATAEAQRIVEEAESALWMSLVELAEHTPQAVREEVVTDLYWNCPELTSHQIAHAFGYKPGVLTHGVVHPFYSEDLVCPTCQIPLRITSRTQLKQVLIDIKATERVPAGWYPADCPACVEHWKHEAHKEWNAELAARARRRMELATMPYREYLQTPEWKARRASHLRSAGYRCQVCNAADTVLDLHHRTYERRGDERRSDLVVLCRDCHHKHHFGGEE